MKSLKRILSILLVICFAMTMLPMRLFVSAADEFPSSYTIYPKPQNITYHTGGIHLENVNLVITENADAPTVLRLEKMLSDTGIAFEKSDGIVSGKVNILLGIAGEDNAVTDYCAGLNLSDTSALNELDGYILNVSGGNILIMGRDAISLFYGVVTLEQMLAEGADVRNLLINDFADMVNRGTIEGFYGVPWSFEGRKAVIEMSGKYKMNQYIYAPKDDPYHHGAFWRQPYPDEDLAKIKTLVNTADDNNISFIWAIHVDSTFDFTDADDAVNAALPEGGTHASSGGQWWENDRGKLDPVGQHAVDKFDAEE
ncbi:MAG: beta-N-acetylglucosaminidase domain-containing protein, partial [Clostridiales bacterium]|nr:beta-N-acetylglucosaminidase domain-containing protein [Clostridiales bacterium]